MPTQEQFFEAIKAAPEDDSLRLVYADWLDEEGHHKRAELVRLHVEFALAPQTWKRGEIEKCSRWHSLRGKLHHRYNEIVKESLRQAKKGVVDIYRFRDDLDWMVGVSLLSEMETVAVYCFSRGLCTSIACTMQFWFDNGSEVVQNHPIREVSLTTFHATCQLESVWRGRKMIVGEVFGMEVIEGLFPGVKITPRNPYSGVFLSRADDPSTWDYHPGGVE